MSKIVNITSKKQASWIKSIMVKRRATSRTTYSQIITKNGTATTKIKAEDIMAVYPSGSYLSPLEVEKLHPDRGPVMYGKTSFDTIEISRETKSQDELTAEAFAKPATADCIMAHLSRMATLLKLKALEDNDEAHAAFIFADYTTRLLEIKVREVDLYLACEHFIENSMDGFFPTIAKLLKYLGKNAD